MTAPCDPGGPGTEVLLVGGTTNRGRVVRVGDTVRRPWRATSPATIALLDHLESVGFDGAPRFLDVDDQGREVLTYVPGSAITPPLPRAALTDAALSSVAVLLRDYHRAVASFDPAPHGWPASPPAPFGGGLVSHNDVNLDNVVFRDGRAVALIDFDLASPGSRVWDVANAVRLWAPLRPDADVPDARRGRSPERLRLFVDGYGLDAAERDDVVTAVAMNHEWSYDVVGAAVARGHEAFTEYWDGGGAARAARTRRWLQETGDLLREALR